MYNDVCHKREAVAVPLAIATSLVTQYLLKLERGLGAIFDANKEQILFYACGHCTTII
jgi:hypothetical protein